jgi:hypothetical protein
MLRVNNRKYTTPPRWNNNKDKVAVFEKYCLVLYTTNQIKNETNHKNKIIVIEKNL